MCYLVGLFNKRPNAGKGYLGDANVAFWSNTLESKKGIPKRKNCGSRTRRIMETNYWIIPLTYLKLSKKTSHFLFCCC